MLNQESLVLPLLKDKLREISFFLRESFLTQELVGVLEGLSGIALFYFYYAKFSGEDKYADWGLEVLEHIIEKINCGSYTYTFSGGLAGAGWTFEHLAQNGFIEINNDALLSELDSVLLEAMDHSLNQKNCDFLHGGLGYIFYFLTRYKNTNEPKLKAVYENSLKSAIQVIIDQSEKEGNTIKWNSDILSQKKLINGYNLSLSHGMSSILSVLSKLHNEPAFQKPTKELIIGITNYFIENKLPPDLGSKSLFPSVIIPNQALDINSRVAWCYGDLGVALAILKASETLKDSRMEKLGITVLKHNANRRLTSDTLVLDAGICHGSFGNALIYSHLYKIYPDEIFLRTSEFWMENGINMATFSDGFCGFKQWDGPDNWTPKMSLAEGVTGIGLSIIDFLSKNKSNWSECLLIA